MLPPAVESPKELPDDIRQLRLRRRGNSHRGVSHFQRLTELWAYSINDSLLEEICQLPALETLYLDRVTAADLSGLGNLNKLRKLIIIGATKVNTLEWAAGLDSLSSLLIENFPRVNSIEPLGELSRLRGLGVEGGMWKPMRIDSLEPLGRLQNLEFLFLTNTRVKDGSLQPLHRLKNLRVLQAGNFFSAREWGALGQALPELDCDWIRAAEQSGGRRGG